MIHFSLSLLFNQRPITPATPGPTVDPCIVLDFSKDSEGLSLVAGQYVGETEFAAYGLTLAASGGVGTLPRLFDTKNPGTAEAGDPDLGAPNIRCTPSGPGIGEGGEPGEIGENCAEQGLALIIQEYNNRPDVPDDNVNGGTITMNFEPKADYVFSFGILDADYRITVKVFYMSDDGVMLEKTIYVPLLGDNSYQVVPVETPNVVRIVIDMERSGAITYLHFCPGDGAPSTPKPVASAAPITSPTDKPITVPSASPPTGGGECALINLSFEKDAAGNDLSRGDYVSDEWASYGLLLSAQGGVGTLPRLFDTSDPGTDEFGDPDLGSPNETCDPPGPGVGIGGEVGAPGENCNALGFALIVQEDNYVPEIPDDSYKGGDIICDFTKPGGTYVEDVTLLDIDYRGARVVVGYYMMPNYLKRRIIKAENLGNNSVQTISIKQENVAFVKIKFEESGAVPSISFCL